MAQDYSRRIDALLGRRMRVRIAWTDGGESRSVQREGVVSGAAGMGRDSLVIFDRGALAVAASRIIMLEEVGPEEEKADA